MKKTIVILGMALTAFTTVSFASTAATPAQLEIAVYKTTPLAAAIMKGDTEAVKKFIEYGADVNELSNGATPLMIAARFNKADIIRILLSSGAEKNAKDFKGFTAYDHAKAAKSTEAMDALKSA